MKRRQLITPLVLLAGLFLAVFMISCSKKGDAGPAGATGPAGPKGDPGAGSGVIYSDWLDVSFKPDTIHLVGGRIDTIGYYAFIDAPKLTQTLLNSADVKVYVNTSDASDPVIISLPYHASSGLNIQVMAYTQRIQLDANADLGTIFANGKKYQQYRYIIVPGNTKARSAASVNWSDYASAKAYLGLKD
ncbi:collagen-like triple helix repeat-containing protein [Chitinophaga nivalis]|uniref:Collagen-like protein n=1 Tax=Chitinophaga nivalis TaxID=2991709 RepID=A0ABT3IKQ1_9BACT|nr:collagen-like protein [Chitinophaga nivalis]MCW3465783.1 collagen-like protein [Chitinophaga nivalis]MCW3484526.1 collagen-like protein [Chitinophaga nivalis]